MSKSTLDTEYLNQVKGVELELTRKVLKDDSQSELVKTFKITKNDSMKNKIEAILKYINDDKIILMSGLSNSVSKLISICEIVKSKQEGQTLYQYNSLLHIDSTVNPNHKPKQQSETTTNDKHDEEKAVLEEINGSKVFTLPVMYIILTKNPIIHQIELSNWTKQS
ncbi:hypothetical protein SBY92_003725 [Candida maltosa Xu316]|uniref:DNA/RNA-binding protein Alba-like domain-containing protein n=1 Tax=Candida maltosa (strain Xu316) TaxID=1245528 RepID=M3JD84_CANMX|nr:hypothetical protein G210_4883 [Candida maltosa Xu316]